MSTTKTTISLSIAAILTTLYGCGGGGSGGSNNSSGDVPVFSDSQYYAASANAGIASANENTVVTHHSLSLAGASIAYTATVGHMSANDAKTNAAEASFFYIAYTGDNQAAETRPLTFVFAGGPGDGSHGLQLGAFGPKRLLAGSEKTTPKFIDNQDSLLDNTDLVYVDAIGTGFSEAILPHINKDFWGVDSDASVFSDFIRRYIAANHREHSPVYLFGHSYGTARAALVSRRLSEAGIALQGIVLESSILDLNHSCHVFAELHTFGSCTGALPTYALVAAYHNRSSPLPASTETFAAQLRAFAAKDYIPAIAAFRTSHTPLSNELITQLTNFTGITALAWQTTPELDEIRFRQQLIPGFAIGQNDARMITPEQNSNDPSAGLEQPFAQSIDAYLKSELQYVANGYYHTGADVLSYWVREHAGLPMPDLVPDLAATAEQHPHMKILSLNGYYDLNTPFYQTEMDLARLGDNPNLHFSYYVGGHGIYLDDAARPLMKADMKTFYRDSFK